MIVATKIWNAEAYESTEENDEAHLRNLLTKLLISNSFASPHPLFRNPSFFFFFWGGGMQILRWELFPSIPYFLPLPKLVLVTCKKLPRTWLGETVKNADGTNRRRQWSRFEELLIVISMHSHCLPIPAWYGWDLIAEKYKTSKNQNHYYLELVSLFIHIIRPSQTDVTSMMLLVDGIGNLLFGVWYHLHLTPA